MFKANPNFVYDNSQKHFHEPTIKVEVYPENQLPKVVVQSDYGDCEVVTSDIYDLFNQQRIENLGPDVVRDFLARNLPSASPISDVISKMSDEEIVNSIRSRHIQQPSELLTWSKYVANMIDGAFSSRHLEGVDVSSTEVDKDNPNP